MTKKEQPSHAKEHSLVIPDNPTGLFETKEQKPSIMEEVGFSADLLTRVQEVNEVLTRIEPKLTAASFILTPGAELQIKPSVEYAGYHMRMHADNLLSNARLTIERGISRGVVYEQLEDFKTELGVKVFGFYIQDIQTFVSKAFPKQAVTFVAFPSFAFRNYIDYHAQPKKYDLFQLTAGDVDEFKQERVGIRVTDEEEQKTKYVPYEQFEVHVEGQKEPVLELGLSWNLFGDRENQVYFPPSRLTITGKPKEVENLMTAVVELFDKPKNYPNHDLPF